MKGGATADPNARNILHIRLTAPPPQDYADVLPRLDRWAVEPKGYLAMADTFPSSGNAGIGTTTPSDPLQIDTGTGTTFAKARISGRSPAWIFGSTAAGYTGGESFIGLITNSLPDYVAGGAIGDSFFIHGSNDHRIFIGRKSGDAPVMTVDNSTSNVGVGTTAPAGRLAAAGPITNGTGIVQLQGGSAASASHTLALGYGGTYDTMDMKESGYVQAEIQGTGYPPLRLQPLNGAIFLGRLGGGFGPPDLDDDGTQSRYRFRLIQQVDNVAAISGNITQIMASFEMESTIPAGNDVGCGKFNFVQKGGGTWFRALESQAVRWHAASNARTWGIEVGVTNSQRGEEAATSVGIYISAGNAGLLDPQDPNSTLQRLNTGILIDGRPGSAPDGWDQFILCRSGSLATTTTEKFKVDRNGTVTSQGDVLAAGSLSAGADITAVGNMFVAGAVEFYTSLVVTGDVTANSFITTSSASVKENITPLDQNEALGLFDQLTPVKFNFKNNPTRQLIGFVEEDTPQPIAVESKGVDVMAVVATLTGVVQSQRDAINRLQDRVDALEKGASTP